MPDPGLDGFHGLGKRVYGAEHSGAGYVMALMGFF